jgi:hypothetical protein
MRALFVAAAIVALAGCSTTPRPLVPDTAQGPTSYVCYATTFSSPEEVRTIAERQCQRANLSVVGVIGQSWTPLRCGFLTPNVAAFQCGTPGLTPFPAAQ